MFLESSTVEFGSKSIKSTRSGILPSKISKLRLKNEQILEEKDAQYKGKKVSRRDISHEETTYDPELAKYFLVEEEEGKIDLELRSEKSKGSEISIEEESDSQETDEEASKCGEEENEYFNHEESGTQSETDQGSENSEDDENNTSDNESFDGGGFDLESSIDEKNNDIEPTSAEPESEVLLTSKQENFNRNRDVKNQLGKLKKLLIV